MMQGKSYVGVSSISSVDEAKQVISLAREAGFELKLRTDYMLMMGFQVSNKSLENGFSEGNKRIPQLDRLPEILESVWGSVFSTLHYYTPKPENLASDVIRLLEFGSIGRTRLVRGLQLNRVLPTERDILEIKSKYPELSIILQISPEFYGMTTQQLAEKVTKDYPNMDYILLDSSLGEAKEFDVDMITQDYHIFRENGINAEIVFAGGLHGNNVKDKVTRIMKKIGTRQFSIYAEGGLRDRIGEGYGNDILNFEKVEKYLRGASEGLIRL
ncbi:MAG: hypothetical protein ABR981_04920 [Candidatus Micrarchaeaceae archaeon]|jgi:hypothetical protein